MTSPDERRFQHPTEEFLFEVSRKTFLSLWSYANPRQANQKELSDALVVCEPDVVLLSAKARTARDDGHAHEAADRWRAKALAKSTKQLYGASRALERLDSVVRSDGNLGIPLPPAARRRVHRVAVLIGEPRATAALSRDFGKGYVHVLEDDSFFLLLNALDTVTDFVEYLQAREDLFRGSPDLVIGGREEDLLAIYLRAGRKFPLDRLGRGVVPGLWQQFKDNAWYQAKLAEDEVSYAWDSLIEYFSEHTLRGTFEFGNGLDENEEVFRVLARETRFARRMLAESFLTFYERARAGRVQSRMCQSPQNVGYVFLNSPLDRDRETRKRILHLRCFVARGELRDCNTIIGLGINVEPAQQGYAEDVVYLRQLEWTVEHQKEAERIKEELGFFARPEVTHEVVAEYPGA